MEAEKHTVKELFQQDVRYVIPTFQRPYVWNQDQQWEPLWDDVRNVAERYSEALMEADQQLAKAEKEAGTHFLGAIVLQQIPTPTADIERRDVIDGQQRMITLQIMLDAAQEVIEKEGHTKEAKLLRKLVLNDEDFAEGDEKFKLWPTSGDQDAFRAAMTNGIDAVGFGDSRVVQAHEFFSLQIEEWLHAVEIGKRSARAHSLNTALIGLLELVVIDLKTGDDAYVIFETLNARGTPLLASDLVKNFILQTANAVNIDTNIIYEEYWKNFEDKWWRDEVRQGRIVRPRIDVFLNYWLIARQKEEVPSHKVFPAFREYVENSDQGIVEIVGDIQHAGATYHQLDKFDPMSPEGTFLYRWNTMQAGVVTPVLLQLFSASEDQLPREKRMRCIGALESYLVRRMVCRMTTKDYNRLFLELISRLEGKIQIANEILLEYLGGQTSESRLWPTDDQLKNALLDLPLYRLLTRGRLRIVLEALEEALRTGKAEEPYIAKGNLTIEHILPQNWRENWPLVIVSDPEEHHRRIGERDRIKHTIGNLTLVTNKLNPALSNGPWEEKQDGLMDHSTLYLNKQLLKKWGGKPFIEKEIRERGKELAAMACKVWPKPSRMDEF